MGNNRHTRYAVTAVWDITATTSLSLSLPSLWSADTVAAFNPAASHTTRPTWRPTPDTAGSAAEEVGVDTLLPACALGNDDDDPPWPPEPLAGGGAPDGVWGLT